MTNGNTRAAVRARRRPERPLRGQPQPRPSSACTAATGNDRFLLKTFLVLKENPDNPDEITNLVEPLRRHRLQPLRLPRRTRPVFINGGPGTDTIVIIGTPIGDIVRRHRQLRRRRRADRHLHDHRGGRGRRRRRPGRDLRAGHRRRVRDDRSPAARATTRSTSAATTRRWSSTRRRSPTRRRRSRSRCRRCSVSHRSRRQPGRPDLHDRPVRLGRRAAARWILQPGVDQAAGPWQLVDGFVDRLKALLEDLRRPTCRSTTPGVGTFTARYAGACSRPSTAS